MKTMLELKDEVARLADEGRRAALARNLPRCMEVHLQLEPLLRELSQRSQDREWNQLADDGNAIYGKAERHLKSRAELN